MPSELNFEQIVRDHQAMVFRTLMRLTGRSDNTEDLAQEVFLRLYRALPAFRGEAAISTYLYRIVVNAARDEWKRRGKERPMVSIASPISSNGRDDTRTWEEQIAHPSPDAEQELSQQQLQVLVDCELQKLTIVERSVLVLYHQEERTYEQIALALELPLNTVRTHLHRGRRKLRQGLQKMQGTRAQTDSVKTRDAEDSALPPAARQSAEKSTAWQAT